jgi:Short C-terminal domain/Double zinc ribbon
VLYCQECQSIPENSFSNYAFSGYTADRLFCQTCGGILTEIDINENKVSCSNCRKLTDKEAKYCQHCGAAQSNTPVRADGFWECKNCGERIENDFTTCWSCGAESDLPEDPVPSNDAALSNTIKHQPKTPKAKGAKKRLEKEDSEGDNQIYQESDYALDRNLVQAVREKMLPRSTEYLAAIWKQYDRTKYSREALEAIRQLLKGRGQQVPEQLPIDKEQPIIKAESNSTSRARWRSFTILGLILGALLGYLLRPSIPLIGKQLDFETVISQGTNLKGMDQILVPLAETSFNYLLFGSIIGAIVGLASAYLLSKNKNTNRMQGRRASAPVARFQQPTETTPAEDIADKLKRLAQLRDTGILTEEEFQAKKKDLLNRF